MVQTFGVNANNDIYIGSDGNLVILSGIAAVATACAQATKAQLGEMVLAVGEGIPNFQVLWIGTPDYVLWQSYIQQTLLNVDGVTGVTSLTLSLNGGTASYEAYITTIYGTTIVNG